MAVTDFHKIHSRARTFCKELYTEFHENLSDDIVVDTRSQTDGGRSVHIGLLKTHQFLSETRILLLTATATTT